jgi:hypothetical protein
MPINLDFNKTLDEYKVTTPEFMLAAILMLLLSAIRKPIHQVIHCQQVYIKLIFLFNCYFYIRLLLF